MTDRPRAPPLPGRGQGWGHGQRAWAGLFQSHILETRRSPRVVRVARVVRAFSTSKTFYEAKSPYGCIPTLCNHWLIKASGTFFYFTLTTLTTLEDIDKYRVFRGQGRFWRSG